MEVLGSGRWEETGLGATGQDISSFPLLNIHGPLETLIAQALTLMCLLLMAFVGCWISLWNSRGLIIQRRSRVLSSVTRTARTRSWFSAACIHVFWISKRGRSSWKVKWCQSSLAKLTCLFQLIRNYFHCSDHWQVNARVLIKISKLKTCLCNRTSGFLGAGHTGKWDFIPRPWGDTV